MSSVFRGLGELAMVSIHGGVVGAPSTDKPRGAETASAAAPSTPSYNHPHGIFPTPHATTRIDLVAGLS